MSSTKSGQTPAVPVAATNGAAPWLPEYDELLPNLDELVTEDGKPVDNLYVEKLYKLLIEPLFTSWRPPGEPGRLFVAMSNVGWFTTGQDPPLVPDVMLSLDVVQRDPATREGRSYFQWILGKPPDLAIEVVSDDRADEPGEKMRLSERRRLPYYVIHDPLGVYDGGILRGYQLQGTSYVPIDLHWIEQLGLGLVMWDGTSQGITRGWLRWCDRDGVVLPTGEEAAERLRAQLRKLGIEPEA
jgi:hypothetical protein